jgi:hypothetical protein
LLARLDQPRGQLPQEAVPGVTFRKGRALGVARRDRRPHGAPQKDPPQSGFVEEVRHQHDGVDSRAIDEVVDERRAHRAVGIAGLIAPPEQAQEAGLLRQRQVFDHLELDAREFHGEGRPETTRSAADRGTCRRFGPQVRKPRWERIVDGSSSRRDRLYRLLCLVR